MSQRVIETFYIEEHGSVDLVIIPIVGDGACLFRALAYHILGNQERHSEIRMRTVSHVRKNWQEFQIFTVTRDGNVYDNSSVYFHDMRHDSCHGSLAEVRAASQIYEMRIEVYREKKLSVIFGDENHTVKRLHYEGSIGGIDGHYSACLPLSNSSISLNKNVEECSNGVFNVVEMPKQLSLYSALSFLINDSKIDAVRVRKDILSYVVKHFKKLRNVKHECNNLVNFRTGVLYRSNVNQLHSDGGYIEMVAASELYGYRFELFKDGNLYLTLGKPTKPIKRMRLLGELSNGHFDVLEEQKLNVSTSSPRVESSQNVNLSPSQIQKTAGEEEVTRKTPGGKKCRRLRFTDRARKGQLKRAAKKHAAANPQAHINSVTKFKKRHPLDNLRCVRLYNMKYPEVNRDAVRRYTQTHPEIHQTAVAVYSQQHPEVHRKAVKRYADDNPGINAISAKRFQEAHPSQVREKVRRQQKTRRSLPWKHMALTGFSYDPRKPYEATAEMSIGSMNQKCNHCNALKWKDEFPSMCCQNGKVRLSPYDKLPDILHCLLTDNHPEHKHFLKNIRKYNGCFQMTSFGAREIITSTTSNNRILAFKVLGQVYHKAGSLFPNPNKRARYLQIYFVGEDQRELEDRCTGFKDVKKGLVKVLQRMLHEKNSYIRDLKTIIDIAGADRSKDFQVVIHSDRVPADTHRGRCNAPTTNEVALVMIGQQFDKRDIVLHSRGGFLKQISEIHRSYDALQYPLMFPYGEDGYKINLMLSNPIDHNPLPGKHLTSAMFYAYRIMIRDNDFNRLSHYCSLLSQYLVDMYAKIETERLNYLRHNQTKLRVESYAAIRDAMITDREPASTNNTAQNTNTCENTANNIGQRVILPSTFVGGARYLNERTQDAMTYVRHYGTPDLFITFTCNPKWHEITEALFSGQKSYDRHDVVARVFHLKVKKMIQLLTKGCIFGDVKCYMFTVEWQKRGLPHVHMLLWLENKLVPSQIDTFISAEIPDPINDPKLFNIVKTNMMHGPCGNMNPKNICMRRGRCSKMYPKVLSTKTFVANNGYPMYRRRSVENGGRTVHVRKHDLDNGWVVPYNPVLLRHFDAHINVEYCNDIKAIKYILKYINKGTDQAAISLERELDEIKFFETGRYLSTNEAVWRILQFSMHERFPTVMHLAVHLEDGQRIYFTEKNISEKLRNSINTTLTGFFEICAKDDFAKTLLYIEVASYYRWIIALDESFEPPKKRGFFQRRKLGTAVDGWPGVVKSPALCRIYTVHPSDTECYHLRMLLHVVRGPTSFDQLKTVDGVILKSFKEACLALGLLEDGQHWVKALEEASIYVTPYKMRELFSIMLVFCSLPNPIALWDQFKLNLADDLIRRVERDQENIPSVVMDDILNQCLIQIEDIVLRIGGQLLPNYSLPATKRTVNNLSNREYLRETSYDTVVLADIVTTKKGMLTPTQRTIYDHILNNIELKKGNIFFLDAPGGTGKTFLLNLLLATVRCDRKIALAVASSGIAATLLDGGRTAHSTFKLPINLVSNENPACSISKQSDLANVLRDCKLIVWDEATMMHKGAFEALDRCLKDMRDSFDIMGGITVLLAGDFRQTLPVISRGTRPDEVNACIKKSILWPSVKKIALNENLRVKLSNDPQSAGLFADLLLKIGNGSYKNKDGLIEIPETLGTVVLTIDELIQKIYPDIKNIKQKTVNWFCERAILCPTNARANNINELLMEAFDEQEIVYKSVDSGRNDNERLQYPVEFLNSQNPPGLPVHELRLKIGSPIMLLRNLFPPKLCNGTRLQVKSFRTQLIEATILTGSAQGETVYIPKIPLEPTDYPIEFRRLQFPVKVCFAMTINKAQGQTLKLAGIDLRDNCFSHGQLYVGVSRVGSSKDLVLLAPERTTLNVVYPEIL